jgi:D-alanine-D-alanine ligase
MPDQETGLKGVMKSIVVLKGGVSPEREVSLVSGNAIAESLRKQGFSVSELDPADYQGFRELGARLHSLEPDLVFLALHGGSGENGELQAALDQSGFRFTGSGSKACAVTMDKYVSKLVAREEGIPVPDYILMREDLLHDYNDPADYANFTARLGLPLIVKPNDGGSSVGITRVERLEDLKQAVNDAFSYSNSVLLEQFVHGRELTVTVLDGKSLPVVEIKPRNGWYDYANKYTKGYTEYLAPAPIPEAVAKLLQLYAQRLWVAFDCKGYARMDFRYDGETPYFLEVNTLPGMTPLSLTPMAAKCSGMDFDQLMEQIIKISIGPQGRKT